MRNRELIQTLYDCVAACNFCADSCLDEENVHMMVECIRTDRECAAICEAAARVLAQDSSRAAKLLEACEEVCLRCAEECGKHDNPHCQACAKACRKCAEACVEFA